MSLSPGTRLGPYAVVAPLGAGGMGEVYRARDSRLNRDVALKILPETFLHDPDRVVRFEREAQVLASLNHPNIGAIHGIENEQGAHVLVLELVEGPTLADRIAHGPIPPEEALAIARQIADALECAHEQGIVHRDLKPANIKVRDDGTVKVLDFGLAKIVNGDAAWAGQGAGRSATITTPAMTSAGMILGTAAYMSPEQAKGRSADKRSDIWAFGCVLYEMLSGGRAFPGEDVGDTLANILKSEPDWNLLPARVSPSVRRLLRLCLTKDRQARPSQVAIARFLLDDTATVATPPRRGGLTRGAAVVGASLVAAAIAAALWFGWRPAPAPPRRVMRFVAPPAGNLALAVSSPYRDIAMFPDGDRLAYVEVTSEVDEAKLLIKSFDRLDDTLLTGLKGVTSPFVSPDGKWIGFFAQPDLMLRKVSVDGGRAIDICRVSGLLEGATWGRDGNIVFATTDPATGLLSVSANGGEPRVLTTPDPAKAEADHVWPSALPNGHGVLFTVSNGGFANSTIAALDLRTGKQKILIRQGRQPEYVSGGFLVYATANGLRAVRFDEERLEVGSDPISLIDQPTVKFNMVSEFSVSRDGTLAYVPSSTAQVSTPRSLVWVDRDGREDRLNTPVRPYAYARLSPDATRVALSIRDADQDIWVLELDRGTMFRLTPNPAVLDTSPVWTPDGTHIVYASGSVTGGAAINLFSRPADGSGEATRLTTSRLNQVPTSMSRDGSRVLFVENATVSGDVQSLLLRTEPVVEPLLVTPFNEANAMLSPDDRWLAYESNESGKVQIFVRPFPKVTEGRVQISTDGGTRPLWARNGQELFYFDAKGNLMVVPVHPGTAFSARLPSKLFDPKYFSGSLGVSGRTYDVSPDGQRFLMIKDEPDMAGRQPQMVVVLNWREDLETRLPKK